MPRQPDVRDANMPRHPLSFAQERLWFLEKLEPDTPVYNVPWAVRIHGPVDLQALQRALDGIIKRHSTLRTSYHEQAGVPFQTVRPPLPGDLELADLRSLSEDRRAQEISDRVSRESSKPFDLESGRLLRAVCMQTGDTDRLLLFVSHHIATDAWSTSIFFNELATFYNAAVQGRRPELAPLPLQYWEFATRQQSRPEDDLAREQSYWLRRLADAPAQLAMPLDHARAPLPSYEGASVSARIPESATCDLRALARQHNATPFMALLAIYFVVLHRYTDQHDLCVGIPMAGRTTLDVEPLMGLFVNMLVIREQISPSVSFTEFLRSVRDTCLDAYDHQNLPFERLVALLQPHRTRNRTPLFQTSFTLQSQAAVPVQMHQLDVQRAHVDINTAKFDLNVVIRDSGSAFDIDLMYASGLFDRNSMQRLLGHFVHACQELCSDPSTHTHQVLLAPEAEQLSTAFISDAITMQAPCSIPEAFAGVANRSPDTVALQLDDRHMTYSELHQASNQLAVRLLELGVPKGARIGVYLEPSFDSVVSYLAILKAGAGYVPLDPSVPAQRTIQLIAEAHLHVLLTHHSLKERLPEAVRESCFVVDDERAKDSPPVTAGALPEVQPDDLAYVIFTSGSTGRPKGVQVPQRGVLRLVTNPDYIALGPETRLLHLASPAFDAATFELWGPLLNGGTCVLSADRLPSISQLGILIRKHNINTLWLTSSWFNTLIDEDATALSPLQQLLVGGERLSVPHVHRALQQLPFTQLVNGYGPTENTTFSCCYPIPRDLDPTISSIPIGRPICGDVATVLDAHQRPVSAGVPGELCIGGDGLALGYLGDDALTQERFIQDPRSPDARSRLFRTGDRVRLLPSGQLEFLGRLDRQLKVRGFRVEPGEIEHVLMRHSSIGQAYVTLRKIADRDSAMLVAYVRSPNQRQIDVDGLTQYIAAQLPDYMVPEAILALPDFPRNAAGKIDEGRLPAPHAAAYADETRGATPPSTTTERQVARLWQTILARETVGVNENFFEIGGHSLLAVRLVAQIESAFGISLPLSVLFDAPTVAALASRIETIRTPSLRSTILPIRGAQQAPLFVCIPPGGSSIYHFSSLARYLPSPISMVGAQALGIEAGESPQHTVENMAAQYVADLRKIQPEGPYYLGGRCFGAFVAFEMAQQLVRQGSEVGLLVLMDPSAPPGMSRDPRYYAGRISYFKRRGQLGRAIVRHAKARIRQFQQLWIQRIFANASVRRMAHVQRAHRHAQFAYKPTVYRGNVVFLGAQEDYDPDDPRALWKLLTEGDFELHLVPGDHRSMTQEPLIRTFARELGDIVLAAQERDRSPKYRGLS